MRSSLLMQTIIVMLALEWELCNQDPVVFCYRIGVSLRASSSGDSPSVGDNDRITRTFTSFPVQR
jgi:hypothetical protein